MQNVGMSIKKTCKKGVMVLRLWVRREINIGEVELLAKNTRDQEHIHNNNHHDTYFMPQSKNEHKPLKRPKGRS